MRKAAPLYVLVAVLSLVFNHHYHQWTDPIHVPRLQRRVSGIPADYYDQPSIIPRGMPIKYWLFSLTWEDEYEMWGWDCSKMSAFTEWALENAGHSARIVISPLLQHAWVEVYLGGKWVMYDATIRLLHPPGFRQRVDMLPDTHYFEDLYELQEWYGPDEQWAFEQEWAWWNPDWRNDD